VIVETRSAAVYVARVGGGARRDGQVCLARLARVRIALHETPPFRATCSRCRKRTCLAHIAGRLDALADRRISFPDRDLTGVIADGNVALRAFEARSDDLMILLVPNAVRQSLGCNCEGRCDGVNHGPGQALLEIGNLQGLPSQKILDRQVVV